MKLLIIGLNYAPEPVGIGPYTAALAETMHSRGHQVSVVAGEAYYPQWRRYGGQPRGWSLREENGIRVRRCPHYIPAAPSGARRIVHHLSFAVSALLPALREARRLRPDVVFTVAPSLMSVPVAVLAAKAAGAKLWTHVQDFEVEAAFATGLLGSAGSLASLARSFENRVLGLADKVSSISPQMCSRLADKGVPRGWIYELRNWADDSFVPDPGRGARYRREWSLGERKVALYSGNIANKQGIETVIEAARQLAARRDIAFVICGQGPNRARLQELASGLGNIQFHDLQPASRMGELLSLAEVHLLPQIVGAADLVLPSKLTNMLASGRPVVATAAAGTGLYSEVEGCGICTPPGDAVAMAAAVARLCDDPVEADRLGQCGKRRARECWSRAAILARFEACLVSPSLKAALC